jgi:hypothetical protein
LSAVKNLKENKTGIVRISNTEARSCNHCCYGNAILSV